MEGPQSKEFDTAVYFSANDAILPWARAFLASLRETSPGLPVVLIPFNDQCESLLSLQRVFDFQVYTDPSFADLEELGERYEVGHTPHGRYWFRRYAAFWGVAKTFIYLDARQVVLADLQPYLESFAESTYDLVHFDTAIGQVYEPGPHRESLLVDRRGRGFNSGRWFSKRGAVTREDLIRLGYESLRIRHELNPRNTDQAFINYVADHLPMQTAHVADLFAEVARSAWARRTGSAFRDRSGIWRVWDHGGLDHLKQLLILHWAGIRDTPTMPHRAIYRKFRDQTVSSTERLLNISIDSLRWPWLAALEKTRTNRQINQAYKWLRGQR